MGIENREEGLDVLNRDSFIRNLIRITGTLSRKKKGCCFGIDGVWGSGKTFVLERFEKKMKEDGQFYVYHYNCWKYDYYQEPVIAIIAVILECIEGGMQVDKDMAKADGAIFWRNIKEELAEAAGEWCKNKIGVNLIGIVDKTVNGITEVSNGYDMLHEFREALEKTQKIIRQMAERKTVLVVVDELDRCLPEYAIKILERLHHIFDGLENVVVIVSMDKGQLKNSVRQIFGSEPGRKNIDVYLRKFFAFHMSLDNGTAGMYCKKYGQYFALFGNLYEGAAETPEPEEMEEIEKFFAKILQGLDMRTQERIFRKAEVIHELIADGKVCDYSVMVFEILYLIIVLRAGEKDIDWLAELIESDRSELGGDTFASKEQEIEYMGMLQDYARRGVDLSHMRNGSYIVCNTVLGRAFFWVANIFSGYRNGVCGQYYYPVQAEFEINLVRYFSDLMDIIDLD